MAEIQTFNGHSVLVDDSDYEYLSQWNWSKAKGGYVIRCQYIGYFNGKRKNKVIYMHRVVNQTPEGMETDHINGDKLDNRKANLRSASRSNNAINKPKQANNTSGYKGVYWNKQSKKWLAAIKVNNKQIHIGLFPAIEDAATAYNLAALKYFGEFAVFNDARKSCV